GNVARVLARLFGIDEDIKRAGMRKASRIADALVYEADPGGWNQALMELGATVCTPRTPDCGRCPLSSFCRAKANDRVHELPVVGEKTKPKPVRVQALVAKSGRRILLARRRSEGLYGGMWEPPSIDGGPSKKQELLGGFPLASVE